MKALKRPGRNRGQLTETVWPEAMLNTLSALKHSALKWDRDSNAELGGLTDFIC